MAEDDIGRPVGRDPKGLELGVERPVRDRQVGLDVDREAGDAEAAAVRAEPFRPGPARFPGDRAEPLDLRRVVPVLEIGVDRAPLAVGPQVAGPASVDVGRGRPDGLRQPRQALFPGLGEARRSQVEAQGGVFDERAEAQAAVRIDVEIAPAGQAGRVEPVGHGARGGARDRGVPVRIAGASGEGLIELGHPGRVQALGPDIAVAPRVAGGREIEPGGAHPPARAPRSRQADHGFVIGDVRPHGDDLDRERRPRFPEIGDAPLEGREGARLARDGVVDRGGGAVEGDELGARPPQQAGDRRGDQGAVRVQRIPEGLPDDVREDLGEVRAEHGFAAGDGPLPAAQLPGLVDDAADLAGRKLGGALGRIRAPAEANSGGSRCRTGRSGRSSRAEGSGAGSRPSVWRQSGSWAYVSHCGQTGSHGGRPGRSYGMAGGRAWPGPGNRGVIFGPRPSSREVRRSGPASPLVPTACAGPRSEDEGHRPVVDDVDVHEGLEDARLDGHPEGLDGADEVTRTARPPGPAPRRRRSSAGGPCAPSRPA